MKNLTDYLNEALNKSIVKNADENSVNESENKSEKNFTFDFSELENSDEIKKSLEEYDCCSIEDNTLNFTVSESNMDCVNKVIELLNEYVSSLKQSQKRFSNEQYAQKIIKFEKVIGEVNKYIDEQKESKEEDKEKKDKKEEE